VGLANPGLPQLTAGIEYLGLLDRLSRETLAKILRNVTLAHASTNWGASRATLADFTALAGIA
jgi:hypothetical protein